MTLDRWNHPSDSKMNLIEAPELRDDIIWCAFAMGKEGRDDGYLRTFVS
jgi:hypothetical protein